LQISIDSIEAREDPYQLFLDYFKDDETKRKYNNYLFRFLKLIPNKIYEDSGVKPPKCQLVGTLATSFVRLAEKKPKIAKNIITAYIEEGKKQVSEKKLNTNTIPNQIKPIKSLLDSNDVLLNWKIIYRMLPRPKKTKDRAYTREELQRMIEASPDITDKLIIELFSSAGFRLESWNYFVWEDIEFFKNRDGSLQGGSLVVYRDDPESYTTFFTPEAARTLEHYREIWKAESGKYPLPGDPLIKAVRFPKVRRLNAFGVKRRLDKIITKIGLRPPLQPGKKRYEVALGHGFRKYFNTMLREAKVDFLDKEDMMGHKVGLESHYERYRDESNRFSEYEKAIPFLTISDTERLRFKAQQLEDEKTELEKIVEENKSQKNEIQRQSQSIKYLLEEIKEVKKSQ